MVARRMPYRLVLPPIPPEQRTALVEALVGIVQMQAERIQRQEEQIELLKEEIRILKGLKKRPQFKPSGMEKRTEADQGKHEGKQDTRRRGSDKRNKTAELVIHEEKIVAPSGRIPCGSRFKGYRDVVVQELEIQCRNTRYRLERWVTPQGESLCAELPAELAGHHFGPKLRSYILYQHHHCQVTQPLLHEQLREWGIDISTGAVDAILTSDQEAFHAEKDELLQRGLATARYVTVDDSGARHQGHNGYVTHIGNAFFAWFCSTCSKSRINFLTLLCAGAVCYRINKYALEYMGEQGLPAAPLQALVRRSARVIDNTVGWEAHLDRLSIHLERHRRIATEGA
ncbi:MAG: IS66 family transposase, partial [Terriglobia bacterium]